jgi:hypothetical protein
MVIVEPALVVTLFIVIIEQMRIEQLVHGVSSAAEPLALPAELGSPATPGRSPALGGTGTDGVAAAPAVIHDGVLLSAVRRRNSGMSRSASSSLVDAGFVAITPGGACSSLINAPSQVSAGHIIEKRSN